MTKLIINKNDYGQRIDKFLKKTFPKFPKSAIYKAIRRKNVKINGKRCSANLILNLNDVVEIYGFNQFLEIKKIKKNITISNKNNFYLDVVYEDKNLIIVNKPYGLISHPKKTRQDSVIGRILHYLTQKKELILNNENSFLPALCNRLDTNTSGLIVAAKNFQALKNFNEILKLRQIIKTYCCLVEGVLKKQNETLIHWLKKDILNNKVFVTRFQTQNSKIAVLNYNVLKQLHNYAEIEVKLHTGRCHQIRAQMAFIGHPIVGDYKYGSSVKTTMKLCSTGLFFQTKNSFFSYLNQKNVAIKPNFN